MLRLFICLVLFIPTMFYSTAANWLWKK